MLSRYIATLTFLSISSLFAAHYSMTLRGDTTKFDYAEKDSNGLLDTEKTNYGNINGLTLSIDPQYHGFYSRVSTSKGDTDYVGGTNLNPTYGSYRTTTTNTLTNYEFGYKVTIGESRSRWEVPVMVGIGYRRWLRQLHGTAGVSGYDELYDWGYYNFGIGFHYDFSSNINLGVDASYRKAFNSQMHENFYGYTFDLKNVHGYTISVPLELKLDQRWSILGIYNYEYWNINESNHIVRGLLEIWEPDSETKNETLSIGLKLTF